jgi:hypothetical protein
MFNKKFYLVCMAVLVSVSLFVIGCPTEAEDGVPGATGNDGPEGPDGGAGASSFPKGDYNVAAIQHAVDNGGELILSDVTITGGGVVDFKKAKVFVSGILATAITGGTFEALLLSDADVTFAEGATFKLGDATDVAAVTDAQAAYLDASSAGKIGAVATEEAINAATEAAVYAVENYALSAETAVPPAGVTVIVYGKLTVPDKAVAPLGKVEAIGTVELSGTNATALDNTTHAVIDNAEVVTSGNAEVDVTLPATVSGTRFWAAGDQDVIKVRGGTTSFTAHVRGNGVLALTEKSLKTTITGSGRIVFDNAAAAELATGSSVDVGTTGYIVFKQGLKIATSTTVTLTGAVGVYSGKKIVFVGSSSALSLTDGSTVSLASNPSSVDYRPDVEQTSLLAAAGADLSLEAGAAVDITVEADILTTDTGAVVFNGPATFGGNVELTAGNATFESTASFADNAVLTLVEATSTVTLNAGASLGTPYGWTSGSVWSTILGNSDGTNAVVLTPAAGTTLTFGADRVLTQSGSGAHSIAISGTGAPGLYAGATYTVASESDKVGTLSLGSGVNLTLGTGALAPPADETGLSGATPSKLVLTGASGTDGASLAGEGTVVLGNASITGGANGSWQAVGASTSVALTATAITGTGTSPVLAALTDDSAVITLATGHTDGDGAALTVTNATIDLSAKGAVNFPYADTTAATLVLKGGTGTLGALKLGSGDTVNSNANLKDGIHSVLISGTDAVIKGAFDAAAAVAGLISGGTTVDTNDATITGLTATNDVTIKMSATLESSSI